MTITEDEYSHKIDAAGLGGVRESTKAARVKERVRAASIPSAKA